MASTADESFCVKCGNDNAVVKCGGCLEDFCYKDYGNHRDELNEQLDEVNNNRDRIEKSLLEPLSHPQKHSELKRIDQWESEAIDQIKRTAESARTMLLHYMYRHTSGIRIQLKNLNDRLKEARQENDFIEYHLKEWNKQLAQLKDKLTQLLNVKVTCGETYVVTNIIVDIPLSPPIPNIDINAKWIQNGLTVAGGNEKGKELNQLSGSTGVYIADDQTVYVADCSNHRIMQWKNGATSGRVVAGGKGRGDRNDQLNCPANVIVDSDSDCLIICDYGNRRVVRWPLRNRKTGETIISNIDCWFVTMDKDGCLYVSDIIKHEVTRYRRADANGIVVAGGNGQGSRLNQLHGPYYICVDHDLSVYVSDYFNHRVVKWLEGAKEGIVIAGGQDQGNDLTQLSGPYGIAVDQLGSVYVVEWDNQRVMRWPKGVTQGSILIGGNGEGEEANQFNNPCGLSFDLQNNLYIVDYFNRRVQKFNIDSS